MNRSHSESDLQLQEMESQTTNVTPTNFMSQRALRAKKRKESDSISPKVQTEMCDLADFKEEMRSMISSLFTAQQNEIKKINPTLRQIQETNASIQSSIAFLTAQNEDFKKKIDQLELKAKEDRKQICILEDKIESMQKGNRKANFEIKNVPKKPNETKEDLIKMVTCLSTSVAANVTPADVMDIYRVRGKQEGVLTTPVVVEMSSTILKTDLLKKCKLFNTMNKSKLRAKHLGFVTSEETAVFISEQLTPKSSRLYFLARDLIKSTEFKFCWTSYGNVYVRKTENSPIITITSEAQINQLLQKA
ncbi:hypothetical protein JYU34_012089 [Plutella xylostella]|uniref:FP protein C-terminal domain-containing protein n=1 Tax=Plutella xylostella TaxID=51655 RepID=A0ABQ7QER9_PLUXY|nr:hypothetical protein JYU34_012089 [Plutella xylostella]